MGWPAPRRIGWRSRIARNIESHPALSRHRIGELYTRTSGSVAALATFVLIHGGGGSAWDWHLVARALRERGHDAVAVDLPIEDESAGWL
jgi:pimeloyl-ACP methyl ester carboxylesterase